MLRNIGGLGLPELVAEPILYTRENTTKKADSGGDTKGSSKYRVLAGLRVLRTEIGYNRPDFAAKQQHTS